MLHCFGGGITQFWDEFRETRAARIGSKCVEMHRGLGLTSRSALDCSDSFSPKVFGVG